MFLSMQNVRAENGSMVIGLTAVLAISVSLMVAGYSIVGSPIDPVIAEKNSEFGMRMTKPKLIRADGRTGQIGPWNPTMPATISFHQILLRNLKMLHTNGKGTYCFPLMKLVGSTVVEVWHDQTDPPACPIGGLPAVEQLASQAAAIAHVNNSPFGAFVRFVFVESERNAITPQYKVTDVGYGTHTVLVNTTTPASTGPAS